MNKKMTSKCYQWVEIQSLPQPINLPADWLFKLGKAMAEAQNYGRAETANLQAFLKKNVGKSADYASKKELSDLLKIIYQGYTSTEGNAFSSAIKKAIPAQIYEAQRDSCPEGFHDRVGAVISGLTFTENMDGFLSQIRQGIVETTARQNTNEVHAYNRFFTVASTLGYGITALCKEDRHTGGVVDETIEAKLQEAFDRDYQPLNILYKLLDAIKGRMGDTYAYHGKDENGYVMGDYDKFNAFLNRGIGKKEAEEETNYAALDEESALVTDMNWPLIKQGLLTTLCDKQYFKFTPMEKGELMGLLTTKEGSPPIDLKPLFTGQDPLIKDMTDLLNLLSFIDPECDKIKLDCIKNYLDIRQTPLDINHLLKAIQNLTQTDQAVILKKVIPEFSNALLQAPNNRPIAIEPLLKALQNFNQTDQAVMLKQVTFDGWNALMMAASSYSPIAVKPLLEAIQNLNQTDQAVIFKQVTPSGSNALMIVARNHPTVIKPLLKAIQNLSQTDQAVMLKQVTSNGSNALLFAVRHLPTAVEPLLNAIQNLNQTDQALMLKQVTPDGCNALMIAVRYSSTAVGPLLKAIQNLNQMDQAVLLKQAVPDGWNALMFAIRYSPTAVEPLLKAIQNLNQIDQAVILKQVDFSGRNALMQTLQKQPTAVEPLLKAIQNLNQMDQAVILKQVAPQTWNALMTAALNSPTVVEPLMKVIQHFNQTDRAAILKQVTPDGWNALVEATLNSPTIIEPLMKVMQNLNQTELAGRLKQVTNDLLMIAVKLHATTAVKAILEATPACTHTFEAKTEVDVFKEYTGAILKNKILSKFVDEIENCESLEALKQFKKGLKTRPEYTILKTGQDRTTRFFKLNTSSIAILTRLIEAKKQDLMDKPLNPRSGL